MPAAPKRQLRRQGLFYSYRRRPMLQVVRPLFARKLSLRLRGFERKPHTFFSVWKTGQAVPALLPNGQDRTRVIAHRNALPPQYRSIRKKRFPYVLQARQATDPNAKRVPSACSLFWAKKVHCPLRRLKDLKNFLFRRTVFRTAKDGFLPEQVRFLRLHANGQTLFRRRQNAKVRSVRLACFPIRRRRLKDCVFPRVLNRAR